MATRQSQKPKPKLKPFLWRELEPKPVIGVDEAGCGCLAGPVFAAAVILAEGRNPGYTDSKLLTQKQREEFCLHIQEHHQVCVASASVAEIDHHNIFHAARLAMRRAIEGLAIDRPAHVLVDGAHPIKGLRMSFVQTPLVKGDLRATPISAASIVAKVSRDRYMCDLAKRFPHYGFEIHKGYATEQHRQSLRNYGPCSEHRRSFTGVKEYYPDIQGSLW